MNIIVDIIRKVIVSSFLLYGYNLISVTLELIIPINIVTVLILVIFGYPSLFSLILIQVLIY